MEKQLETLVELTRIQANHLRHIRQWLSIIAITLSVLLGLVLAKL
jgi:hypothetical protein